MVIHYIPLYRILKAVAVNGLCVFSAPPPFFYPDTSLLLRAIIKIGEL